GAKVYLTLNTLLTDRELPKAAEVAAQASAIGADAVLIQDLGVLRMLRQVAPDLPVHASTQMTLHNLDGVKMAADLGLTRAVLSRELSRDQIEYICQRAPIEIEVFAHGALCMCYSGQCFLSSIIGGRSGNRGLCAQPCRLKYGWMDKADAYPLSLKDLSLAGHLRELRRMGVACVKLEGRMKRPEYVAVVTGIYARAIKEDREPTEEELEQLRAAFSRQGFTQGYYLDQQGPDMFGVREETREPKELFAAARNTYQSGEAQRVPVTFYAMLRPGEPARVFFKLNSLTDREVIDKIAEASCAGVRVDMIIRGISCLKPGVPGKTENVHVRSIVGRFLEHARVYAFGVDSDMIYLSSADMMTRNTEHRVEIALPVLDPTCRALVHEYMGMQLRDNVKARSLTSDGTWVPVERAEGEKPFNSQEALLERAYRNAEAAPEPVIEAEPASEAEPQPVAPKVQEVQATVIEPEPAPAPQPDPQVTKPAPETSARRDKPAGKTKAIERHRPGRVRMGLGLIGLGLKTLITGKTK
ncbi:MAG: U32 family peptidase, partial [Collinsella sp.]|nr:U32 family peptidase [Collinsella sp.]